MRGYFQPKARKLQNLLQTVVFNDFRGVGITRNREFSRNVTFFTLKHNTLLRFYEIAKINFSDQILRVHLDKELLLFAAISAIKTRPPAKKPSSRFVTPPDDFFKSTDFLSQEIFLLISV